MYITIHELKKLVKKKQFRFESGRDFTVKIMTDDMTQVLL